MISAYFLCMFYVSKMFFFNDRSRREKKKHTNNNSMESEFALTQKPN